MSNNKQKVTALPGQHHCLAVAPVGHIGAVRGPLPAERGSIPVAGAAIQVLGWVDAKLFWKGKIKFTSDSLFDRLSSACGRSFECSVYDPVSVHSQKTKHTKLLPQADERGCIGQALYMCT